MCAISKFQLFVFVFFVIFSVSAQEKDSIPLANSVETVSDTTFVNLKNYSNDFFYDLKYATEDNFLKEAVYDCDECYLRLKTVNALIIASKIFEKDGYKIKLFL